jgi:dTDP-4-dehydrorhamnose 3,5-epimerase
MDTRITTWIEGVHLIPYFSSTKLDDRGSFTKFISMGISILNSQNLDFNVKELFSTTSYRDVIRGMHLQQEPMASNKLVIPFAGDIVDVLIDLRPYSRTYSKIQEFQLSSNKQHMLFVPKGVAHGFKVVSKAATLIYVTDQVFDVNLDLSINPLSISYDWQIKSPIISQKDKNAITLEAFLNAKANLL